MLRRSLAQLLFIASLTCAQAGGAASDSAANAIAEEVRALISASTLQEVMEIGARRGLTLVSQEAVDGQTFIKMINQHDDLYVSAYVNSAHVGNVTILYVMQFEANPSCHTALQAELKTSFETDQWVEIPSKATNAAATNGNIPVRNTQFGTFYFEADRACQAFVSKFHTQ